MRIHMRSELGDAYIRTYYIYIRIYIYA
jgi:hypothetical protein